eukprot:CAMPEP_0171459634 /NCGR_PEP_ID=MMETSP0945-20130129/4837_1 /TAXON_ID=109269 /ORGANISM="Vaucheria litorea, Strain CCMP2940" /LENGTH=803 /DNA_ID=CAMNT_0011985687 /DNA_START=49 /DNA_END=2461 /DNA_ORIENTATION=-
MALYGWGYNGFGQIGALSESSRLQNNPNTRNALRSMSECKRSPKLISDDLDEVKMAAAGDDHSLVVTKNGEIFSIGRGNEGQLGINSTQSHDEFQTVISLKGCDMSSFVLDLEQDEDELDANFYAMGHLVGMQNVNARGHIYNRVVEESTNMWLNAERNVSENFDGKFFDAEGNESDDQSIENEDNGSKGNTSIFARLPGKKINCPFPIRVKSLKGIRISSVSAGYAHTCCVSTDGKLYVCGYNDQGQLGLGHRCYMREFVENIFMSRKKVHQTACGQHHTVARVSEIIDGQSKANIYSWGSGSLGQLGLGQMGLGQRVRNHLLPILLDETKDDRSNNISDIVDIACGSAHNVAVAADGRVYGWGHSEYNQQGNFGDMQGTKPVQASYFYRPRLIQGFGETKIVKASCGGNFSLGITSEGYLFSWGWHGNGVLGGGFDRANPSPERIPRLTGVKHISAGMNHALAVANRIDLSPHGKPALLDLVDDSKLADAKVAIVGGEIEDRKEIHVHRCIISVRCPQLDGNIAVASRFINEDEKERKLPVAELETELHADLNSDVLAALIVYIYSDRLKFKDEVHLTAIGKLGLSLGLPRLAALCANNQNWIQRQAWYPKNMAEIDIPTSTFYDDMNTLLESGKYADVRLHFKEDKAGSFFSFNAHKSLLCRYDYFRALLLGSFSESIANNTSSNSLPVIDLSGFVRDGLKDPSLFKFILIYIYSGFSEPPEHVAVDINAFSGVLTAAQALGIDGLVTSYERAAGEYAANGPIWAAEALEFAETFGLPRLSKICSELVALLSDDLEGSKG